jgi:trigger factor
MKTEFTEVSETRKQLSFEIPTEVVEAEIERVTKGYTRAARIPGFRPGKAPSHVVRQRYRDQILSDVAHDLIPRLIGDELKARHLEPVTTPDVRDVVIEEGRPLTFAVDFETLPPIDPGEYKGLTVRRPPAVLDVGAVDSALEGLRQQAARWTPVEHRPAERGDTLIVDLTRTRRTRLVQLAHGPTPLAEDEKPEALQDAPIELGSPGNPPELETQLSGTKAGDVRSFTITHPPDESAGELAGGVVDYTVTVKSVRRRELLPLDDEFAKEVSDLDTLDALRERVRENLQRDAQEEADHQVRHDLLRQLGARVRTAPEALVEQEIDRRLEELVRRLMDQGVDPMKAEIDWQDVRARQKAASEEAVRSTLVLDEIARREGIEATEEDVAAEVERFAQRAGRTSAAVRARLEKEGALDRVRAGIRREQTVSWLLGQANVVS